MLVGRLGAQYAGCDGRFLELNGWLRSVYVSERFFGV